MKKVILSIVAGTAVLAIASCGGNNENNQPELTQQQLDSIQAATEQRVKDSIAAEQQRIADSTRVADSLIQAGKAQATPAQKTTTTTTKKNNNGSSTTTTTVEEKKPVSTGDQKANERFEQKNTGSNSSQEVENKLNDRFKNRN